MHKNKNLQRLMEKKQKKNGQPHGWQAEFSNAFQSGHFSSTINKQKL